MHAHGGGLPYSPLDFDLLYCIPFFVIAIGIFSVYEKSRMFGIVLSILTDLVGLSLLSWIPFQSSVLSTAEISFMMISSLICIYLLMRPEVNSYFAYKTAERAAVRHPPRDADELYEEMLRAYATIYSNSEQTLENKIKSFMEQGLSREEAIRKLAEKEKIM
jgi:hypothetical protein